MQNIEQNQKIDGIAVWSLCSNDAGPLVGKTDEREYVATAEWAE